jgi:Uncharacterised nucleotidyltransferase
MTGSFWPSPSQRELLEVALGSAVDAQAAWQRLRPTLDLDNLEPGSFTLLPLVYQALVENGSDDSLLPRLKGIYKNTWVRNNLLLERIGETADALASAGLRPLFVAGTLFAARFYPNLGLRPTPSVEFVADPERLEATCDRLGHAGWTFRPDITEGPSGPRYFSDDQDNLCVVRTTLAFDFTDAEGPVAAHAPLLEEAEPHALRSGTNVLFPATTDALLVAVVLGARRKPTPGISWILDVAMILRNARDRVDWTRLLELAAARRQTVRLREALTYVSAFPAVDVPRPVLDRLASERTRVTERLIYAGAAGSAPQLGALPEIVAAHLAESAGRGTVHVVTTFPASLRRRWGLESSAQLPLAAGRRAVRLISGRTSTP